MLVVLQQKRLLVKTNSVAWYLCTDTLNQHVDSPVVSSQCKTLVNFLSLQSANFATGYLRFVHEGKQAERLLSLIIWDVKWWHNCKKTTASQCALVPGVNERAQQFYKQDITTESETSTWSNRKIIHVAKRLWRMESTDKVWMVKCNQPMLQCTSSVAAELKSSSVSKRRISSQQSHRSQRTQNSEVG